MVKKRDDGYHDVKTVMQSVSLCDTVSVILIDSGEFFAVCNLENVPTDEKNIAVRAAMLYAEKIGVSNGARIEIEKRIPMAAGLAGGSTDAAATLLAMNKLYGNVLSNDELISIAASLGADVPFCLFGGCSYSDGRGDILHDFPQIPKDMIFLVACGGEGVSTPWAYSMLDAEYDDFKNYIPKELGHLEKAICSGSVKTISENIFNVFENHISVHRPIVEEIKTVMMQSGALNAMMSGSGPSVFGVFSSIENAQTAKEIIVQKGYFASVCHPTEKRK